MYTTRKDGDRVIQQESAALAVQSPPTIPLTLTVLGSHFRLKDEDAQSLGTR